MPLGKRITIGLIALPVAELLAFVLVAMAVGIMAALALLVLTSLVGALVLRQVGRSGLVQFRAAVSDQPSTAGAVGAGQLLVALGGILLVLPGFITGVAGTLLLVPWARRRLGATIGRAIFASPDRSGRAGTVDLAPDQWRRVPDPELAPAPDHFDKG